jgi:ssDNA-binding replication factor A large subunit
MIKLTYDDIVSKIKEKAGLTEEEINSKVKAKMDELSGLISKDGAAHIIANELKINLFEEYTGKVKIDKLLPGMRSVEVLAKVRAVYEVREFSTDRGSGTVGSFVVGDETGSTRIVCWHDLTKKMQELKEGDVIRIKNGYVRDNNGKKEVHLNQSSELDINPPGETVQVNEAAVMAQSKPTRKKIAELNENDNNVEILGTVVQAFEPRYYATCPQCRKRAMQRDDRFTCNEHGDVKPEYSYVMNAVIDDGTETIRAVFFREQAETLVGKSKEEFVQYREFKEKFDEVKIELLGQIVKLTGRVSKNTMFDRLEFMTRQVETNPDPKEELERLNNEIKNNA